MEQTERIISFFEMNTNALSQISVDELHDIARLTSVVIAGDEYSRELKKKSYDILCNVIMNDHLSLEERWSIFWTLSFQIFVMTEYDECRETLENAYASIYFDVEKQMPKDLLEGDSTSNSNGPIIIVTSQFLSEDHAPTRRVLDYAYTLKKNLGIPVKIINDSGLHLYHLPYIENNTIFSYREKYTRQNKIPYKDITFDFFQVKSPMPNLQEMENVIYSIKSLRPRMVLNVGGSCLTSDLCRKFTKTVTINCSTSMPCSMGDCLVLCRKLRNTDNGRIKRLYPWQYVVESVFNYIMPDDNSLQKYTREMFGIPEDAWLIVSAGNRMRLELDRNFMKMIDDVIDSLPNCHFLIIGGMKENDKQHVTDGLSHTDKIHFAGSIRNGSQAIRLGNIYIQPTRKGGGRAAFEALYYEIPVITTKYGDTWDVCGPQFEVNSYEEMAVRIKELWADKTIYELYQRKSKEHANILEDMTGMFTKLLQKLNLTYTEKVNSIETSEFSDLYTQLKKSECDLNDLKRLVHILERRLRDNEWANIFHDTIRGSEWLINVSLSPGRCAIGYPGLYALYRSLDEFRPRHILEMGLGQSTRMIGSYAKYFGAKHNIVEHDASWINFFLNRHGKSEATNMVCLEREEGIYDGKWIHTKTPIKYYKNFSSVFTQEKFDFIFIDGPQGSSEYSRVDITELLPECLEESFVIMMDDSERTGEHHTLQTIARILISNNISCKWATIDGIKNTDMIVSDNLEFLLSI